MSNDPNLSYAPPPPSSSGLTQLKIAAILLIVFASLGWLYGIVDAIVRIINIRSGMGPPPGAAENMRVGFFIGMYGMLVCDLLTLPLAPLLIFGAIQMLRRRSYQFAKVITILGMLPVTANCCCIATLPVGIWALVVLNRPDVRDAFQISTNPQM